MLFVRTLDGSLIISVIANSSAATVVAQVQTMQPVLKL